VSKRRGSRIERSASAWKKRHQAARRSLVNILNGMEHERAPVALPGLDAITKIRDGQRYGYRTAADHNRAYERFEKSAGFNRLHPGSRLSRAASDFDFRPGEPGNKDGSRSNGVASSIRRSVRAKWKAMARCVASPDISPRMRSRALNPSFCWPWPGN